MLTGYKSTGISLISVVILATKSMKIWTNSYEMFMIYYRIYRSRLALQIKSQANRKLFFNIAIANDNLFFKVSLIFANVFYPCLCFRQHKSTGATIYYYYGYT